MRFCSLGSGSEGNGLVVELDAGGDCILIDCGFGPRELRRRLERVGIAGDRVRSVVVTHEHGDHVGGAVSLANGQGIDLWWTDGTARGHGSVARRMRTIHPGEPFSIGGLTIEPFTVPHDAREPVQFVIDDGRCRLGVLTDIGHATAHVVRSLSRLDALVLECNHDPAMLEASHYPAGLKRRISGDYGHLSNDDAAQLLARIDHSRLRLVVAAHLSRSNNDPELALAALASVWNHPESEIRVADQDEGLFWVEL